jgi:transcriptional repressor NrdR
MKCPFCNHLEDRVLETRDQKDGLMIRRRRECLKCRNRFTTTESLLLGYPLVVKKDGRREEFSHSKILRGIQAACQKRPISLTQMDLIANQVARWALTIPEKEISSQIVGEKVMTELKTLDDVAYVRFASVYKTFQDTQDFLQTISLKDQNL